MMKTAIHKHYSYFNYFHTCGDESAEMMKTMLQKKAGVKSAAVTAEASHDKVLPLQNLWKF